MKIARVFPTKTSMSPTDPDAYFDEPDLFITLLNYDEVHISCTFTWDIKKAKRLGKAWEKIAPVIIGGVAIDGESDKPFKAGIYLKKGITITSRGCPNNCSFCMVRRRLIEFDDFPEGNIIQDNNILACSDRHWRFVVDMLKKQKAIEFKGGLEKYRITPKIVEDLQGLRIKSLWLSCDTPNAIEPLRKTVNMLQKAGFKHDKLYCFVLIGDDREENLHRLKEVWRIGCKPFAQLYKNKENSIVYSRAWKRFQRQWSRPAITRNIMKTYESQRQS